MFSASDKNDFKQKHKTISLLRQKIKTIENSASKYARNNKSNSISQTIIPQGIMSLGNQEIDYALPWGGLPTYGLHEFSGDTSALGFLTILLNRLTNNQQDDKKNVKILWCQRERDLCAQGLTQFGFDLDEMVVVYTKNNREILWVMEEGLKSSCFSAVVGRPYKISPLAGKRLQLVAEQNATMGILFHKLIVNELGHHNPIISSLTRWHITAAPSIPAPNNLGLGLYRWNLELKRCRLNVTSPRRIMNTGQSISWQVEYCNETNNLSVVTRFCNGSNSKQNLWKIAS